MDNAAGLVCVHFLATLHAHLGDDKIISKDAKSESFHNLSMQALSKSGDAILIKFVVINKLNESLNDLLTAEALAFETERLSRMITFFNQPVFVREEQTDNNIIEKDIIRNILKKTFERIDFLTDTGQINLTNAT